MEKIADLSEEVAIGDNTDLKQVMSKDPLYAEYRVSPLSDKQEVEGYFSIDGGSTGSRSVQFTKTLDYVSDVLNVRADYAFLQRETDWIPSRSKALIDNLEIKITDITPDTEKGKDYKQFQSVLIAKETIMRESGAPIDTTHSNVGKVAQMPIYINAITSLGLRAFMSQSLTGQRPETVICDVTIALPPEDTKSKPRLDLFKRKLSGTYMFRLVRLGYEVKIVIPFDRIYIEDEASAVARCWATENKKKIDMFSRVLVIDGGGRSTDLGLLENGALNARRSKTLPFGGNKFETEILDHYTQNSDGNPLNLSMIREALKTGQIQDGNTYRSIKSSIVQSKKNIAKMTMTGVSMVLDSAELTPSQINLVLCAGGLFRPTGEGQNYVESLAMYLQKMYQVVSPHTQFDTIKEPYPIVYGLMYYRVSL